MRNVRGLSVRMVGIFLLLILLAMMFIGGFLWINLESFYANQHDETMQRSLSAYMNQAYRYFTLEKEIHALEAERDQETSQTRYQTLSANLSARTEEMEVTMRSLHSFVNPNSITGADSSSTSFFQVAVLSRDLRIVDRSPGVTFLDNLDPSLLASALIERSTRTLTVAHPGEPKVRVIAQPLIDSSDDSILGLVYLESDISALDANMANLRTVLMTATVLSLVATSLFAALLATSITQPIIQLTQRAQTLAQGDYGTLLEVRGDDEVGRLAESFNTLTVRLQETMDEIADEKGKIEAMLHSMAEGVIAVNDQGLVIHINPSARRMFLLDDEHVGVPLVDILEGYDQELHWRRALMHDEMVTSSLSLVREGGTLSLSAHSVPFVTAGEDTPSGVVMVLTDISEQERLEETRRDFLANVSHELRTPLTTVKSYIETLLDGALQSEEVAERFLTVVLQEADRMSRLVSELLQMAQQDAPVRPENLVFQDLRYIVRSVERRMLPQFADKKQEFVLDICEEEAMVLAPQDRLDQLCVNLLSNASKYTPEGGCITLRLLAHEDNTEIIVEDTGIGIAAEHLPRLFERFYRVDKSRTRGPGGTGLGLAIVKQIIDRLGGRIDIQSEVGKGTRISVWLPKPEQFALWGGEYRA